MGSFLLSTYVQEVIAVVVNVRLFSKVQYSVFSYQAKKVSELVIWKGPFAWQVFIDPGPYSFFSITLPTSVEQPKRISSYPSSIM